MILTINGKQAALKKGSSIEYVSDYATKGGYIVSPKNPLSIKQESKDLKGTIARLNERLDESFVTINTVTGDKGIKTCASRMQTTSLDLLRRRHVYPTRRQAPHE